MTEETKDPVVEQGEIYAKVYGKLVNIVLPAFVDAVNELEDEKYPDPGGFMINSMAGITATVLRDSIRRTSQETGMPLPKARKKVLKQLHEVTNLFVRRLDQADI